MCTGSTTGNGKAARLGAADCLSLAAAPIFALMALLAGVFGGASGMHSSGMHGSYGLIDGMALMYLLMSVIHGAPWLTLLAIRRRQARVERILAHLGRDTESVDPVHSCFM